MILYQRNTLLNILILCILFTLSGCVNRETVDLEPNDDRPIMTIQVADSDEADLLIQQLELDVVQLDGNNLYFYQNPTQLSTLKGLGYELNTRNSYETFSRIVRINKKISETELMKLGIQTINREADHLIVKGTLSQLKSLKKRGVRISPIKSYEPRPRQIKLLVSSREDVARIGALGVDIYSAVRQTNQSKPATYNNDRRVILIHAGAFDNQIDQLKELGFEVEILPNPIDSPTGEQS